MSEENTGTDESEVQETIETTTPSPQITIQPGSSRMTLVPNAGASPARIVVVPILTTGQPQGERTQTS